MSGNPRTGPPRLYYSSLILLAVLWLAMLLFGTGPLDQQVYLGLYAGGSPMLVRIAKLVTRCGDPTIVVTIGLIVAALLALRDRFRLAIALSAVFLIGRALVEAQKYGVGRVRPGLEPHLVNARTFSFVSGHAGNSMIVFLALALTLVPEERWRAPAIVCAVLVSVVIGLSRVMLGVHWPSDVIGGWAFGAFWTLATLRPAEKLLAVPPKH